MQKTVRSSVSFSGTGLHSGCIATISVRPAPANHGIWFRRTDVPAAGMIEARYDNVKQSPLCTLLTNEAGLSVSTIEHLMAALAGCGITNAIVDVDGPEIPILDGSAVAFMHGIMTHGVRAQPAALAAFKVLKHVRVEKADAWAEITPSDEMRIDFQIDFADRAIGRQFKSLKMANGSFARELSDSRTFCLQSDVDAMQAQGLALGGAPGKNAVVFDGDNVVSPGGLRHVDEPVRHKMLDALGDLALAGAPVIGHYTGYKAGHALTNDLLHALFATPGAVERIVCDAVTASRMPGHGLVLDEIPEVA